MQPTYFRAYAFDNGVHNPVNEGALGADGIATFNAAAPIAYVVFYADGTGDQGHTVAACVDGPFGPGDCAVSIPAE